MLTTRLAKHPYVSIKMKHVTQQLIIESFTISRHFTRCNRFKIVSVDVFNNNSFNKYHNKYIFVKKLLKHLIKTSKQTGDYNFVKVV